MGVDLRKNKIVSDYVGLHDMTILFNMRARTFGSLPLVLERLPIVSTYCTCMCAVFGLSLT